jgi:hypothetical protein
VRDMAQHRSKRSADLLLKVRGFQRGFVNGPQTYKAGVRHPAVRARLRFGVGTGAKAARACGHGASPASLLSGDQERPTARKLKQVAP